MPVLTDTELGKSIRNNEIAELYYFYGKDVAMIQAFTAKLVKKLIPVELRAMDFQSFDGNSLDLSQLADCCEVCPMLADRVVVTINDLNADNINSSDYKFLTEILSKLPDTTTVIIYATGVDLYKSRTRLTDKNSKFVDFCAKHGAVCDFALKSPVEMAKTIMRRVEKSGCSISRDTAELLAQKCAGDTVLANTETDKLCAYVDGGEITSADVELLCVRKLEADSFRLAAAIAKKDSAAAFGIMNELFDLKEDSFSILAALSMGMMDIYRAVAGKAAGKTQNDVLKDFSYPPARSFAVKNAFRDSSRVSVKQIRKCMLLLSEADIEIKSLRTDNRIILEKAVAGMLN